MMMNACHYFNRVANKESLYQFIFGTLDRQVLHVHKDFQGVKLKGRKTILDLNTNEESKRNEWPLNMDTCRTLKENHEGYNDGAIVSQDRMTAIVMKYIQEKYL